jgi:hypothetical protein
MFCLLVVPPRSNDSGHGVEDLMGAAALFEAGPLTHSRCANRPAFAQAECKNATGRRKREPHRLGQWAVFATRQGKE